ncbi:MAG: hypothetical protein AAF921_18135 [Cyanobacteria bacterium P01_D01_bin.44]
MKALKISKLLTALLIFGWVGGAMACVPSTDLSAAGEAASETDGDVAVIEPEVEADLPTDDMTLEDAIALPPETKTYVSENGRYKLEVSTADGWATPQAEGRLYRLDDGAASEDETLLWQQPLPQEYGPRFVSVGTEGEVLLLDEYINVASPYAVMVMDLSGEVVAQHSFDDVQAVVDIPRAEMVEQAETGWWISDSPEWEDDAQVSVATSGKTLIIDLTNGQLSL